MYFMYFWTSDHLQVMRSTSVYQSVLGWCPNVSSEIKGIIRELTPLCCRNNPFSSNRCWNIVMIWLHSSPRASVRSGTDLWCLSLGSRSPLQLKRWHSIAQRECSSTALQPSAGGLHTPQANAMEGIHSLCAQCLNACVSNRCTINGNSWWVSWYVMLHSIETSS